MIASWWKSIREWSTAGRAAIALLLKYCLPLGSGKRGRCLLLSQATAMVGACLVRLAGRRAREHETSLTLALRVGQIDATRRGTKGVAVLRIFAASSSAIRKFCLLVFGASIAHVVSLAIKCTQAIPNVGALGVCLAVLAEVSISVPAFALSRLYSLAIDFSILLVVFGLALALLGLGSTGVTALLTPRLQAVAFSAVFPECTMGKVFAAMRATLLRYTIHAYSPYPRLATLRAVSAAPGHPCALNYSIGML